MDLPETFPEIVIAQYHLRISGDHRIQKRPVLPPFNESTPDRILQHVRRHFLKGVFLPVFLAKDVVVRLLLPLISPFPQVAVGVFSQESNQEPLLAGLFPPQEKEMHVVRHEAIGRADRSMSSKPM